MLSQALTDATGVHVDLAWDGSGYWDITWRGGPTVASLRALTTKLLPTVAPGFVMADFHWHRGMPPAAMARLLIAEAVAGERAELWELRYRLADMEYPERPANEDEARMVRRLLELAGVLPTDHDMRQILDTHGLADLSAMPAGLTDLQAYRRSRSD